MIVLTNDHTLRRLVPIASLPLVDADVRFIFGNAVFLLNATHELIALSFDPIQIIVGQFAPLLLHATAKLLPIALYGVPVHSVALSICKPANVALAECRPAVDSDSGGV